MYLLGWFHRLHRPAAVGDVGRARSSILLGATRRARGQPQLVLEPYRHQFQLVLARWHQRSAGLVPRPRGRRSAVSGRTAWRHWRHHGGGLGQRRRGSDRNSSPRRRADDPAVTADHVSRTVTGRRAMSASGNVDPPDLGVSRHHRQRGLQGQC